MSVQMIPELLAGYLSVRPDPAFVTLLFFAYSFAGYLLECVVLSIDNRRLIYRRGFANHLPFCIIYGFGAMMGFILLQPFANNIFVLFIAGALGATFFEYLVGLLQLRLFGSFWWDYNEKPYNHRGMICLESTIGWGLAAVLVVKFAHMAMVGLVHRVPANFAAVLAIVLVVAYLADFILSTWQAGHTQAQAETAEEIVIED